MSNDFHQRDNALNQRLQQLVEEVRKYPANGSSTERVRRRIALNNLISTIQVSESLSKQTKWLGLPNYLEYYREALQQTCIEICQKIDEYNPQYPVMAWVNKIFTWRFNDLVKKDQKRGLTQLPKNQETPQVLSLEELNKEPLIEDEISELEQIKEIIENDPEGFFKNEKIQGYPQANLQVILLCILERKRWKEISQELDVPMSTAASFYQRRVRKIIAYVKKYI
ncbi:sigma-70 family RNA polymerase sigma factor [Iningainema tapete]|uniref:Sigma-70 family RNA polymerase sigma factor n=1 Tax=Iningainema tapete BLCC-T55 TaxID=2748662 RepID=A0A8J7C8Z8_9CYAN|nr:sigma-70 family RNA polymerase sigma factor [Iningainema tapete]MBD2777464.1 sigma-70 family RNA polymerase sigma factor [Iningainema tapete BLCC-T55]